MATIRIQFQCGCGFTTGDLQAAVEHAEREYHGLTASGTIDPPPRPVYRSLREDIGPGEV